MQYNIVFLTALSATGALAAPALRRDNHMPQAPQGGFPDIDFNKYQCPQSGDVMVQGGKRVSVRLFGNSELARTFDMFSTNGKFVTCTGDEYNQISVDVGDDAQLKDLRCAVADDKGKMIGASRGENVDFTFSDGGNQTAWDFLIPTNKQNGVIKASKVVCDLEFKKIDANQRKVEEAVNVLLREKKGGKATTVGPFNGPFFGKSDVGKVMVAVEGNKKFETLEVQVGRLTNPQLLRCAAKKANDDVTAVRGANTDTTFSDNNAGEWTFIGHNGQPKAARGIKEVVCASQFKQAAPAAGNNNMPANNMPATQ